MFRNVHAKQSVKENVCVLKRRHTAQTFAHVTMISARISHIRKYLEDQVDDDDAMPVPIRDEDSCSDSDQLILICMLLQRICALQYTKCWELGVFTGASIL